MNDPLLVATAAGKPRRGLIEVVAEVASTNTALIERCSGGDPVVEGAWLVADRQNSGRGRAGREWRDGSGNFMGSTAIELALGDPPPQTLALTAGVAATRAIVGVWAGARGLLLKWPNDVLVGGAKLGGILLERQGDVVVVGVGINLADAPRLSDRPTTSLAAQGCNVSRDLFAEVLAVAWADALASWHLGGWPALRDEWQRRAHPPGTRLRVHDGTAAALEGTYEGIGEAGAAHLRLADGSSRVIHAGDVELVGAKGSSRYAAGD